MNYLLIGLILASGLVAAVYLLRMNRPSSIFEAGDAARSRGPIRASIQIIEYSDFQCPACQIAQGVLDEILRQHQGKVRLIYKHFPLPGHKWAFLAHQAAECAAIQNKFWTFHDRLYQDQSLWGGNPEPPLETFLRYAKEEALDLNRFTTCLADKEISAKINQEKSAGAELGVRSTPSFFVNGKLAVGSQALQAEIEKITNTQSQTVPTSSP